MGFFSKVKKVAKKAHVVVNPTRLVKPLAKLEDKVLHKVDDKVGGAQGWSKVTAAGAVVANYVPVYGQVASAALAAASIATAAAANEQATEKAERIAAAEQLAAAADSMPVTVPGASSAGSIMPPGQVRPSYESAPTFGGWLRSLFGGGR